jgi:hypothetical protein
MKYLFGILLSVVLTTGADGQVEFGVKTGINFADVAVSGVNLGRQFPLRPKMMTGLSAGIYGEVPVSPGLYFAPEINYIEKGFKVQDGIEIGIFGTTIPFGVEAITNVKYIELPLLMKYKFGAQAFRGYLMAGPTLGYAVKADIKTRANLIFDINIATIPINLNNPIYNQFEIGGMAGGGIEYNTGNGKIFLEGSYSHGITELLDDPIADVGLRNKGIGARLGYAMSF